MIREIFRFINYRYFLHMKLVFFVDVDNTLLNNDQIKVEIKASLTRILGKQEAEHFWQHHDSFREYAKLVDFPNITRTYCAEINEKTCSVVVGNIFNGIEFSQSLYPQTLEAITHLKTLGSVFVFSEGDMIYQKRKIEKSGIAEVVDGVFLFEHKLDHLDEIIAQFQGDRFIFIDDRDDKLLEIKQRISSALTIVVCQGHYAKEDCPANHSANFVVGSVAELRQFSRETFFPLKNQSIN